jgi:hypothetical protein
MLFENIYDDGSLHGPKDLGIFVVLEILFSG